MSDAATQGAAISVPSAKPTGSWRPRRHRKARGRRTLGLADPGLSHEARVARACERLSPLLRKVAARLARRLPAHIELEELAAAGALGLVTVVQQHVDKPYLELERLAARRIRGAILDHLRAGDHLSRRQRAAVGALQEARSALEHEGRAADLPAVAAKLGVTLQRARLIQDGLEAVQLTTLNGEDVECGDHDPSEGLVARDLERRVAAVLRQLPERLQTLLSLYYYEELTYQEITTVMGISRSRVCQLHAQALERLRRLLDGLV